MPDPFGNSLNGVELRQTAGLDYLGIGETLAHARAGLAGEPAILAIEYDVIPSVEAAPLGHAEGALPDFEEAESLESLSLLSRIVLDHRNYYSLNTALVVGVGTGVAATFAHTYVDDEVYWRVHRISLVEKGICDDPHLAFILTWYIHRSCRRQEVGYSC